ncbi:hypothetical protein F4678DRAFT_379870 [Xylaria arbuscula]|nr:hypothetical protein F4678DRAFT_379870 [Xylaria arbuscula]
MMMDRRYSSTRPAVSTAPVPAPAPAPATAAAAAAAVGPGPAAAVTSNTGSASGSAGIKTNQAQSTDRAPAAGQQQGSRAPGHRGSTSNTSGTSWRTLRLTQVWRGVDGKDAPYQYLTNVISSHKYVRVARVRGLEMRQVRQRALCSVDCREQQCREVSY